MSNRENSVLINKLKEFIKKYYINKLIKGGVLVLLTLLIFFIFFSVLEYYSNFDVGFRTILFWLYIIINSIIIINFLLIPLLKIFRIGKVLSFRQAADIIGKHFKEIDDKLLNILELSEMSQESNHLIQASIDQKTSEINPIKFKAAIDLSGNLKKGKWLAIPILLIVLLLFSGNGRILSDSSSRILKHNTFFEPKAPFDFNIINDLVVEQYKDLKIELNLEGNVLPEKAYIILSSNKFSLNKKKNSNDYSFLFKNLQENKKFKILAGGYTSKEFEIIVIPRPSFREIKTQLNYPEYTKIKSKVISNLGNIKIPEGTTVRWNLLLENTNNLIFVINDDSRKFAVKKEFIFKKKCLKNINAQIITQNQYSFSDTISFNIEVIKDQRPEIKLEEIIDSLNSENIFSGEISDDYGFEKLVFHYEIFQLDSQETYSSVINIDKENTNQMFYHSFNFNKNKLKAGASIRYYFEVWDNDNINGSKSTKSKVFTHKEKSREELKKETSLLNSKIKSGMNESIEQSQELKDEIKDLQKEILEKKTLEWKEKEKIRALINKQKQLENNILKTIEKTKKNSKNLKKNNSKILEKQKKLQELMEKILDEDTKKLIEELEKILDEGEREKIRELLEKLEEQNENLEKELDRELELFKQLEFEQKTEEIIDKIKNLKELQEKLKNKTDSSKNNNKDLEKEQEEIKKKMEELEDSIKELKVKNKDLENKNNIPKTEELQEEIKKDMDESKKSLEKNKKSKSSKSQEKVMEKLDQLEKKMESMQEGNTSDTQIENAETLRQILENLVKLSFNQEDLLRTTNSVKKENPEFLLLVKQQKKLSDDSKIIEDSLLALSKRAPQIESKINEEISLIKNNIKKATKNLEERKINKSAEKQQFIMTSTNNLALLLSEILKQMQQEISDMPTSCNKPKNCNNPKNSNKPSKNELKNAQKKLNDQLKESMKKGKQKDSKGNKGEDSKKLMEMAKKQELIRLQLESLEKENGMDGDPKISKEMSQEMKENEFDIINNQITKETLNRLENIITKFLESEKADKEQGEDQKREANEWLIQENGKNKKIDNFIKIKKSQKDLLKSAPLNLNPFYKKEVNKYFKRILKDQNDRL